VLLAFARSSCPSSATFFYPLSFRVNNITFCSLFSDATRRHGLPTFIKSNAATPSLRKHLHFVLRSPLFFSDVTSISTLPIPLRSESTPEALRSHSCLAPTLVPLSNLLAYPRQDYCSTILHSLVAWNQTHTRVTATHTMSFLLSSL